MANEVVGIDIVARLDAFRAELGKIPDIGAREAKGLTAALSREIRAAERASKNAADQSKRTATASRDQGRASKEAADSVKVQGGELGQMVAKTMIGLDLLKKGFDLVKRSMAATWERARELDDVMGGDLRPAVDDLNTSAQALFDQGVAPLLPAFLDLTDSARAFIDSIASTGAIQRFANDLADVAQGAAIAARELFGLNEAEKQGTKARDMARVAIEKQAAEVERLRSIVETFADADALMGLAPSGKGQEALDNGIRVLKRLNGELAITAGMTDTGKGASRRKPEAATGGKVGKPVDAREAPAAVSAVAKAMGELRAATDAVAASTATAEEQVIRSAAAQRDAVEEAQMRVWEATDTTTERKTQAEALAGAAIIDINVAMYDRLAELRREHEAAELESIRAQAAARKESMDSMLGAASALAGAETSLIEGISEAVIEAEGLKGRKRKDAMRAAWALSSATAIVEAAINVPLSISQAAAAPWPASIGFMIAAGVASGAALSGVIARAAAGPSFHRGGMAPDEMQARVRRGEGVLTPQGVDSAGGREGVSRLNAGDRQEERPLVVVNQIGSRTFDAMVVRSLDSEGPFRSLVRGITGRPGSWRPYGRA